jgi:hypothetical protein
MLYWRGLVMKNIIIITKKRVLTLLIILLIIIFLLIYLFTLRDTRNKSVGVTNIDSQTILNTLEKENYKLKGMLGSIVPDGNNILYENHYRYYNYEIPDYEIYDLSTIMKNGNNLDYNIIYNNKDYIRPNYDSDWKNFYHRGWLNLPQHIDNALHKLFIYPQGASSIYDFEGKLAFHEQAKIDYHKNINLLIYNFQVNQAKIYNNQIVLIGTPTRKGSQIVAINVNNIIPENIDNKTFLFQLSTPSQYEIDYLYATYYKTDYVKDEMSKDKVEPTYANKVVTKLSDENAKLKQELSFYIPNNDKLDKDKTCKHRRKQIETKLNNSSIDLANNEEIPFVFKYIDDAYIRPIYDPTWKQNYEEGLCYIPTKICKAFNNLYMLPHESNKRLTFFQDLGFHEEHTIIEDSELSFLIYKFIPEKILIVDNEVHIMGIPSRTGAYIISVDKNKLPNNLDTIKLVTPNSLELDYLLMN